MSDKDKSNEATNTNFAEISVEEFATKAPDLYNKILAAGKADGEKAERDRFKELAEACGDDSALLVVSYGDGSSAIEAMKARNEKLKIERDEAVEKASKNVKPTPPTPAEQEFSDDNATNNNHTATPDGKETWEKEFNESAELQSEFGEFKFYQAFKEADKNGQVRVQKKK